MNWGKGKIFVIFAAAALTTCVLFLFSNKASAADGRVVINEIYPAPISSCDTTIDIDCSKEWIELYNPSANDIDLAGYVLSDASGETFGLDGKTIFANDYLVIFGEIGGFSFSLNNDGDTIHLEKGGVIDLVTYPIFSSYKAKSYARIPDANDLFMVTEQTRGAANPSPVIYSDKIYINELLPQPATGSADEYIELYNSSDVDIDLINWQLDARTFVVSTIIKAKEYRVFKDSDINIGLTDTGDTTELIDPNGDEKSSISYPSSKRGQSYSLFGNIWQWTVSLTPGAANILTLESEEVTTDIQIIETDIFGAREQPDEVVVSVTGIVTVLPGKLSSQYFYIQDQFLGIQIYNYSKDFPLFNLGDEIRIIGELDTVSGERRIKIASANDIKILSTHPPPEPIEIKIDDIQENCEGKYIEVVGIVSKTSGNTFYVHGSGEIQIVIRSGTGIKKPKMKVGDKVKIAGILSRFNDSYRILPTKQSDVKIISSSKLANTGPGCNLSIISALIATIISWIISARVLKRQKI
ncbi:MAG: lamin tail domain-containing protein [Patescibacteria group bacterium]